MVAYFRGYCKERLGQSALADYNRASQLPTSYVFPSTFEELKVLQTVIHSNPQDASAHYLLGTLYFSRGLTDAALSEWSEARKVNANLPVLSASVGLALLHEKHDPEQALAAFRERAAPAVGGIILGFAVAQALGVNFIFSEREGGAMTFRRSFCVAPGTRVLVVEDVAEGPGAGVERQHRRGQGQGDERGCGPFALRHSADYTSFAGEEEAGRRNEAAGRPAPAR